MTISKDNYLVLECVDCKVPDGRFNGKLGGKRLRFMPKPDYSYIPKRMLLEWLSSHEDCYGEMRIITCNKPILEQLKKI